MTITLEAIKAEQDKIEEMIATFEAQPMPEIIRIQETTIILQPGEHYAGISRGKFSSHHLILLPGEAESINWNDAKDWATKAGGELPTRCEQSLLFANLKKHFQPAWYWSSEQHASYSDYAWNQTFAYGYQGNNIKGDEGRARAVRRVKIV